MIRLVTGGVRSGKSRFAEALASKCGERILYVATGFPGDGEMERRIARHRERRPAAWELAEAPKDPADAVKEAQGWDGILVDCLSAWVANRLMALPEGRIGEPGDAFEREMERETIRLLDALEGREAVLVTSEAGLGGVSMNRMGRQFQDALGTVNQRAAERAEEVWMVVSGVPWRVKG
ncbi:adenosylcobinamide kinase /adenosylcobinamide-phosphate guanylyltransferase [Melghirimyces profundicolus]|uniref:Adenosylcobinamide kinase n=1 Tax=Melghirimyces profundicolus TaxID=1242148 RepID=A0A2T6C7M5_9BACL|nr:bifunctional adenosylcobinamide kinase/adenosylcobinamide-phosphate guanylyltransferase [Melghirimyces profundicolus]PTX64305.1 adenosylcobinamide kinase /adenosylcobinamide-phosphate guanylyltransferase [Melghirimyces profundicolus]